MISGMKVWALTEFKVRLERVSGCARYTRLTIQNISRFSGTVCIVRIPVRQPSCPGQDIARKELMEGGIVNVIDIQEIPGLVVP